MASASSSKAKKLPDWHQHLLSVPEAQQTASQKSLIKATTACNGVIKEALTDPVRLRYPEAPVKLAVGLLETFPLNVGPVNFLRHVYDESRSKLDAVFDFKFDNKRSVTANLFRLCAQLWAATMAAQDVLHRGFIVESPNEVNWDMTRHLVSLIPIHTVFRLAWDSMRDLGAEALLEEAGSSLTMNDLKLLNECIIAVWSVCSCALPEKDRETQAKPMLEITIKWLKEFSTINNPPVHLFLLTRPLVCCVTAFCGQLLIDLSDKLSISWKVELNNLRVSMLQLADKIYKAEMAAAKASVPRDPARIAIACCQYGNHMVYFDVDSSSWPEVHKEAVAALAEARPYLPPVYYLALKNHIQSIKDGNLESQRAEKNNSNLNLKSRIPTKTSLNAKCASCGGAGHQNLLKLCSQCKKVYYCSKECQTKDWKQHKKVCKVEPAAVKE